MGPFLFSEQLFRKTVLKIIYTFYQKCVILYYMGIDQKKYIIEEVVKLGMDRYASYLLAECTEDEIEQLEKDIAYQKELDIIILSKERELLEMHDTVISIAASKGNANGIQWRLEKINPDRYGNKKSSNDDIQKVLILTEDDENL